MIYLHKLHIHRPIGVAKHQHLGTISSAIVCDETEVALPTMSITGPSQVYMLIFYQGFVVVIAHHCLFVEQSGVHRYIQNNCSALK